MRPEAAHDSDRALLLAARRIRQRNARKLNRAARRAGLLDPRRWRVGFIPKTYKWQKARKNTK